MGKQFSVESFDDMAKAAQQLQEIAETYTEIYTQLMSEAEGISSAWAGADQQDFVAQITGFTEELKAMATKLSTAGQTLDQQRANYVAQQDSNIAQVKKLTN